MRLWTAECSLCNESWQNRRASLLLNITLILGDYNHDQGASETQAAISALATLFTSFATYNASDQEPVAGIKWLKSGFGLKLRRNQ